MRHSNKKIDIFRSGVVALLGFPNAGKSSLLNRMLGEKLAIVTEKPQTTRSRILGILTLQSSQILLLDTPGFHVSSKGFNRELYVVTEQAMEDCDIALFVVDSSYGWKSEHTAWCSKSIESGVATIVALTKIDKSDAMDIVLPQELAIKLPVFRVSSRTGEGLSELVAALSSTLPHGPKYYKNSEYTDRSLRFLVAEQIREVAFEYLSQELPYSLAVEIDSYDETDQNLVRVHASVLVERASQKGIVIGRDGAMLKKIGIEARQRIERLVGCRVFLKLWVKLDPRWSRSKKRLRALGYC